jgi:hypothetical protein
MIYVLTMCIGMTWGMCNRIIVLEFRTMAECHAEREYQRRNAKDVVSITCEERKERKK